MKTNSKYNISAAKINQNVILSIIFTALFLLNQFDGIGGEGDCLNGPCESSCTSEMISSNLNKVSGEAFWLEGTLLQASPLIYNFYKANEFLPAWTTCENISEQSVALMELFKNSYKYGIEPSILNIDRLEHLVYLLSKEKKHKKLVRLRTQFEFLLTNSAFTFMLSLEKGTEYARDLEVYSADIENHIRLTEFLNNIKTSENIVSEILSLQPDNKQYVTLQHEMEEVIGYIKLVENHDIEANQDEVKESFVNMLKYLMTDTLSENIENMSVREQFNILVNQLQRSMDIWESGKMNIATRNTISLQMRSRYADLAYEIETIRSRN